MRIRSIQIVTAVLVLLISAPVLSQDAGELVREGVSYLAAGDFEAAGELLDRAVAEDPDNPYAYAYRSMAQVQLGMYGEAIDDALKVLEYSERMGAKDADPLRLMALSNLGTAYIRMEKYEAAVAVLDELIDTDGDDPIPYFLLGEAYRGMDGEDGLKRALDAYTKAIRLDPEYAAAYFYRGVVKTRLGDEEGGIIDRETAIGLDSVYLEK
ncbi:MAG: tetratricopeptide repeat protein [Deltaproteobacteria bacterium]|nr:tetratricopeptide repeat protein [Candidatus Zymogenaceae bacterium]